MRHIYTNGYYYYVEESEEDCVKSLEYDNGVDTKRSDWKQFEDDKQFHIMFQSKRNGHIDKENLSIPDSHYQEKLKKDDCDHDYCWSIYAKAKDWAEVNFGFLCNEI